VRSGSVLLRAVAAYALLGLLLFAPRPKQATPAKVVIVAPPREPTVVTPATIRVELPVGTREIIPVRELPLVVDVPLPINPGFEIIRVTPWEPVVKIGKLDTLPDHLTPGRRAALRAILRGDPNLLYFGMPPGKEIEDPRRNSTVLIREPGHRGIPGYRRFRYESIGDSLDPMLAEFVRDFNLQMLHAQRRGLIAAREDDGLWRAAARIDYDADELLLLLLDDPTDAIATAHDPETGACELDLGQRDGIEIGMRFVLWTPARPLRRILAVAEVTSVSSNRCRVRIAKKMCDAWPAAPGIRASSPFFLRGRKTAGTILGAVKPATPKLLTGLSHVSVFDKIAFPDFCVVGDVRNHTEPLDDAELRGALSDLDDLLSEGPENRLIDARNALLLEQARRNGAILVPERLVPYLLPSR